MPAQLSALIYLLAGFAIVYLFQARRKKLSELSRNDFPGMDEEGFKELIVLLKTAYERMLYMGVVFFPLAYTDYSGGAMITKVVFFILILLLFFFNIPPRNKVMHHLDKYNLCIEDLKKRGIRL